MGDAKCEASPLWLRGFVKGGCWSTRSCASIASACCSHGGQRSAEGARGSQMAFQGFLAPQWPPRSHGEVGAHRDLSATGLAGMLSARTVDRSHGSSAAFCEMRAINLPATNVVQCTERIVWFAS